MVNEVTAPTRKDKMASRTAATGLGMGGPSDPHEQPGIRQTDRRESWIPYPTLPDSGETEGTMDYADFTRLCQEDADALFNMVNEAYASLEAANRQITTLEVRSRLWEVRSRLWEVRTVTWKTRTGDLRTRSASEMSKQTTSLTNETVCNGRL